MTQCTGVAATWCPRCGDCKCGCHPDGERNEEASDECPLHGFASKHGEQIEHTLTDNIVCPHCGYADRDSWEWSPNEAGLEGDGEATCGSCGRDFLCSRHVSVSYSTRKKS